METYGEKKRRILILLFIILSILPIPAYSMEAYEDIDYYQQYQDLSLQEEIQVGNFDLSRGRAQKIPVLMYHHLLKEDEYYYDNNPAAITVEAFEEQMAYLHRHGFSTISLLELELFLRGKLDIPRRSIVISFDDGYSSNYHYAYPILKKYGFNASIFLITHRVENLPKPFTPASSVPIGWDQVVGGMDVFEYANHSHDLHRQNDEGVSYLLASPVDIVRRDLLLNRKMTRSDYFAYPYGEYNEVIVNLLKELDFKLAFTTRRGYVKRGDSPFTLNRFAILPKTRMMDFIRIVHGIG